MESTCVGQETWSGVQSQLWKISCSGIKSGHSRMIMVHYLYPVVKRRICSKFVTKTKVFFSLLLSHRKITCFLLDYRAARLTVAIRKKFYFD